MSIISTAPVAGGGRRRLAAMAAVASVAAIAIWEAPAEARPAVVAPPDGATVDGRVELRVARTAGMRLVVFAIDGRVRDVDQRPPFAYGKTGALETRRLRSGPHRISIRISVGGRTVVARRRVRVDHARTAGTRKPSKAGRGSPTPAGTPTGAEGSPAPTPAVPAPAWSQEFTGPAGTSPDASTWNFDVGGTWGNNTEMQQYTDRPANAALDGEGNLRVVARREAYTGADGVGRGYTSARLNTQRKFAFRYGRLEARIRMPAQVGYLPQFWTLGSDIDEVGWPRCGEIDISEVAGLPDDPASARTSHMHLHSPTPDDRDSAVGRRLMTASRLDTEFHVYAVTWTPGRMEFSFDGVPAGVITKADVEAADGQWIYDRPHFLVLNVAVGNPWTGPPDLLTVRPGEMVVDWIRHYAL